MKHGDKYKLTDAGKKVFPAYADTTFTVAFATPRAVFVEDKPGEQIRFVRRVFDDYFQEVKASGNKGKTSSRK